ncbi:MAG: RnfABCDGE type electron transport complex subunit B [Methylococcales bacterium]|nr:RnfABCDGE type electron transport complex subunit B [Methylococcales bacterium]
MVSVIVIEQINALLPQTQCGQCGYKGCRPYAEAIAAGLADINQCPPSGDEGISELAALLGVISKPLNPDFGEHKPTSVAFIIEQDCIGCVKCLAVCPVDAILGAAKFMHTVITAECTGCELCIAPCPVDCIVMQPVEELSSTEKRVAAQYAQQRYEARCARKAQEDFDKAERQKKQRLALKMKSA